MKNEDSVRYPGSANLFQFCKLVLDKKYGGIRVIDQDVGQILGFDPADCSHWKKGKKNIRSIHAVRKIAEHLSVDDKLVVDIASGEISEKEAFYEYLGYGNRKLDPSVYENARKEYYRRNASTWTREKENEFRSFFEIDYGAIERLVDGILEQINLQEAPLYLPEVAAIDQNLSLQAVSDETGDISVETRTVDERTLIRYPKGQEAKPYVRFQMATEVGKYFLKKAGIIPNKIALEAAPELAVIQTNVFAARLLTPEKLVRKEMARIDVAKDIVSQLAELFWVSKTFMNGRLKEILESN